MKPQPQCPNCKSYKTNYPRQTFILAGIVVAVLFTPAVFFLVGIPFVLAGIGMAIYGGFFIKKGTVKCRNCKYQWVA